MNFFRSDSLENCHLNVKKIAKKLTFFPKKMPKVIFSTKSLMTIFEHSNGDFPEDQVQIFMMLTQLFQNAILI